MHAIHENDETLIVTYYFGIDGYICCSWLTLAGHSHLCFGSSAAAKVMLQFPHIFFQAYYVILT